ncbi:hypothetical protein [Granulicoccus sp. GXG6511]|uniref:hypothetical protein n=1 Tax=Granulicoccus sp. GXG6511 TaxID=3381351 RepID=UPI003D7C4D98
MNWWLIFGAIGLYAVLQTVLLVWWLWRKGRGVIAEFGVLAERADQLADILGGLDPSQQGPDARERLH